jgi:hypothetical protein
MPYLKTPAKAKGYSGANPRGPPTGDHTVQVSTLTRGVMPRGKYLWASSAAAY